MSIRAHLLNAVLGLLSRRQRGQAVTPQAVRAALESVPPMPIRGVAYKPGHVGGVPGEWVENPAQKPFATLLYLHGGGYVAMSPRTHRALTGSLAQRGLRVFAPDYRLAPEHPFPAALDDAHRAWRALRDEGKEPFFVAGDSAGGGLALALLLKLRDEGGPLPAGAVLFSPWTDLAATGASVAANAKRDPVLRADAIPVVARSYYGTTDVRHPYVSPLYGDPRGLPPLKIFVGEREILLDDSRRVAERAKAAGVDVDIEVWPVVPHVWQLFPRLLPEARRSFDRTAEFLRRLAKP